MKIVTVQDISCYGQCSITVALPLLSSRGIETAILPSSILSTHTSGFKNYTCLDLTNELDKIIKHWIDEKIYFDGLYTGYIGNSKQINSILLIKEKLLNKESLFFVDPAMADNGKLYQGLNNDIVEGMKKIAFKADYIFPNITEAALLTNNDYLEKYDETYISKLLNDLISLGAKKVILTGISFNENEIGAIYYDGKEKISYFGEKINRDYHGTGDLFTSLLIANILNRKDIYYCLKDAVDFVKEAILTTIDDKNHTYGVKFERLLNNKNK